jgi:hypothetical protein
VTPPVIFSAENLTNTTPTTTILFSGTGVPNFVISTDLITATTSVGADGNWSMPIDNISQGTTTINFFAEPDETHLSISTIDVETGITHIINYIKSEPTEVVIFVADGLDIFATEPEECQKSLIPDGCLITTTVVNMSWGSNSGLASEYGIRVNGRRTIFTPETSRLLYLNNNTTNTIEVFARDMFDNESDYIIYEVMVYERPVIIENIDWSDTNEGVKITLYNNTLYDLDLNDWTLTLWDGSFNLGLTGTIPAQGEYVLAKDTGVSQAGVDQTYTEAFYNQYRGDEIMNVNYLADLISYYEFNQVSAY